MGFLLTILIKQCYRSIIIKNLYIYKEPRGDRQSKGFSNIITRNIPKIGVRSNVKQHTSNLATLVEIPKSILKVKFYYKYKTDFNYSSAVILKSKYDTINSYINNDI